MNYGAEPADQVVRYSLEGMEYSLKITGNVAKHVAIFIAAALKDQKKTRGKTRLTRMLKEQRPMKFFTVPGGRNKDCHMLCHISGNLQRVFHSFQTVPQIGRAHV